MAKHIDSSDKIKAFDSIEALTTEIVNDIESNEMLAQRYPVRFIMLNNFDEFKKLAKQMANFGIRSLDLETLTGEGDDWITKDMLKDSLTACESSTFVTPFSEIVRFYNDDDFRGFFNDIILMENADSQTKRRIYIPLIGLQNRFTDFLNHFARLAESAPIWKCDAESQTVEVYFTKYKNYEIPKTEIQCKLSSLCEWLKFWKVQAPQERILCTSLPISAKYKYSKPDNIFNFIKVDNAYEFMTKFMDVSFPFAYEEDESEYWECLLKSLADYSTKNYSFTSYVHDVFNKKSLAESDILEEWVKEDSSSFKRWLLRSYVLYTKFGEVDTYLKYCMEAVTDLDDSRQLPSNVMTLILYDSPSNKKSVYAQERRELIRENADFFKSFVTEQEQQWLLDRTKEIFQDTSSFANALELCTGVFDYEHILLMGWFAHNENNKLVKDAVNDLYPDFAAYHKDTKPSVFTAEMQWSVDYMHAYKKAKMLDSYTNEIESYIKGKNATATSFYQWYHSFRESHDVLAEMASDASTSPDMVYWIDGLGAEFLPYLLYLIGECGGNMKVVNSQITRSTIPTSTSLNRFEGENVYKFGAMDELGHDAHGYKYLYTLNEELKTLRSIVKEITNACQKKKCTVAIVSDHGMSCLSRKAPSRKYDGKFEHEGRYIKTNVEAQTDSDYIVHKNEKDGQYYKVALTHSSLSKVPTHEVHGGGTPEEVLVPFVLLSNKDVVPSIVYKVNLIDSEIMLSSPIVRISVYPEPQEVILTCEGTLYQMKRSGTQWVAELKNITEGVHTLDIKPKGTSSIQSEIKVIGVGNNSDIDDLFTL